jgi:hypothetical protein
MRCAHYYVHEPTPNGGMEWVCQICQHIRREVAP